MITFDEIVGSGRSFVHSCEHYKNDQKILNDLQNVVLKGYRDCTRRTYFIRFSEKECETDHGLAAFKKNGEIPLYIDQNKPDKRNALSRLSNLLKVVENINKGSHPIGLDIGFTFSGLEKIKIKKELLETFRKKSPAYYDNAFARGKKYLADSGLSSPQYWKEPYRKPVVCGKDFGFHLVLIAHFPYYFPCLHPQENIARIQKFESRMSRILLDIPVIRATKETIQAVCSGWGVQRNWIEVSTPLEKTDTEHFGYKDGITAPIYSEKAPPRDENGYRKVHALGEILLGHKRNDGDNLYADLGLSYKKNAKIGLQAIPVNQVKNEFFKNSSFGVLRKMEQRVEKFNAWVKHQAESNFKQDAALGLPSNTNDLYSYSKNLIRSKVMGRTPSGTLLIPGMTIKDIRDDIVKPVINGKTVNLGEEGGFHRHDADGEIASDDDSQGRACPFSSHIRRMNPRDDPITPFIHRPVLRRGMPYTEKDSKGLSGLFICADIEEQFEHLVGKWANNRVLGIPDDSTCKDPIIGNHEPQNNVLYLYSHPDTDNKKDKVSFDEPFVITRGCAYIWFPANSTLKNFSTFTNPFAR